MSRSYYPDPTRRILAVVWPLCLVDMVAWKFYVGGWPGGIMTGFYFLIIVGSIVYLKKTS